MKVDVPPLAFSEGALAGALSPRQLAEKAKANPAGAVPLFESGQVKKWFEGNGLQYPVQGPTAPGMAGVQQFFEALGLAKPPKVDFTPRPIQLEGDPGQTFEIPLEVTTQDKKLVYAYASADQPWIDGNVSKPSGRSCVIQLKVTVPPRPGETIAAKMTVHANGNQKFPVPLALKVRGTPMAVAPAAFEPVEPAGFEVVPPERSFAAAPARNTDFAVPVPILPAADEDAAPPRSRVWLHAIPAILLGLLLTGFMVRDFFAANIVDPIDPRDRVLLRFDYATKAEKNISQSLMFGLQDISSPEDANKKRLTFSEIGQTNSAVFRIDDKTRIFGDIKHGKLDGPVLAVNHKGRIANWLFNDERIRVTQDVHLVAGDPVEVKQNDFRRLYDTCLVRYKIVNQDTKPHEVGFRFLLDTYIGMNDGTPFTIPGSPGLVRQVRDFHDAEIPDYIQALENFDLRRPGTIAQLNLKVTGAYGIETGKLEPPSRVSLTRYPGHEKKFDFEVEVQFDNRKAPRKKNAEPDRRGVPIGDDSAIALYWQPKTLKPGESREFGFTYGVGSVQGLAELTILNPGPVIVGSDFSLVALLANATKGTKATIDLPDGLELAEAGTRTQEATVVTDAQGRPQPAPVTWRIRALRAERFRISVIVGDVTVSRVITVSKSSIF
jgi:hypothetical protein